MSCTLVSAISTARPRHKRQRHGNDMAAWLRIQHAASVVEDAGPVARRARDHCVGVPMRHHQRSEDVALVEHQPYAVATQIAMPLQPFEEVIGELLGVGGVPRVEQRELAA